LQVAIGLPSTNVGLYSADDSNFVATSSILAIPDDCVTVTDSTFPCAALVLIGLSLVKS